MNEFVEMQGRIDEMGCKMAKFVTSPARVSAQAVSTGPQTNSSFAIHAQTNPSITVPLPFSPPPTSLLTAISADANRLHISLGPIFVACLPAPSPPPPPLLLLENHHRSPRICILPPIPVSDEDGASDAEEKDSVDRTIGRSWDGTPLRSIKCTKGHRALHVRHAHAYTQERLAVVPVAHRVWRVSARIQGKPNEYAVTTRTWSCAEHRQSCCCRRTTADKTSIIHDDDNTDNSCICVCNYGILRSLIVRREEKKLAKATPPPPEAVTGKFRAPVGELVAN
ncbi:hypothetical protein BGY98DRAFT_1181322 [Russula aff. rugulosa BPL654]|nr:hypothetical protein BGY98DRAFT_1181322 [Russula aff. rugulosa BPL654]